MRRGQSNYRLSSAKARGEDSTPALAVQISVVLRAHCPNLGRKTFLCLAVSVDGASVSGAAAPQPTPHLACNLQCHPRRVRRADSIGEDEICGK